jgi:hypothetical protein
VTVRVVNTVTYAVCLDDGRHLHPGEVAEIADSERHRGQIAEGQLRLVATSEAVAFVKPQPAPPRPAAQSQEEEKS